MFSSHQQSGEGGRSPVSSPNLHNRKIIRPSGKVVDKNRLIRKAITGSARELGLSVPSGVRPRGVKLSELNIYDPVIVERTRRRIANSGLLPSPAVIFTFFQLELADVLYYRFKKQYWFLIDNKDVIEYHQPNRAALELPDNERQDCRTVYSRVYMAHGGGIKLTWVRVLEGNIIVNVCGSEEPPIQFPISHNMTRWILDRTKPEGTMAQVAMKIMGDQVDKSWEAASQITHIVGVHAKAVEPAASSAQPFHETGPLPPPPVPFAPVRSMPAGPSTQGQPLTAGQVFGSFGPSDLTPTTSFMAPPAAPSFSQVPTPATTAAGYMSPATGITAFDTVLPGSAPGAVASEAFIPYQSATTSFPELGPPAHVPTPNYQSFREPTNYNYGFVPSGIPAEFWQKKKVMQSELENPQGTFPPQSVQQQSAVQEPASQEPLLLDPALQQASLGIPAQQQAYNVHNPTFQNAFVQNPALVQGPSGHGPGFQESMTQTPAPQEGSDVQIPGFQEVGFSEQAVQQPAQGQGVIDPVLLAQDYVPAQQQPQPEEPAVQQHLEEQPINAEQQQYPSASYQQPQPEESVVPQHLEEEPIDDAEHQQYPDGSYQQPDTVDPNNLRWNNDPMLSMASSPEVEDEAELQSHPNEEPGQSHGNGYANEMNDVSEVDDDSEMDDDNEMDDVAYGEDDDADAGEQPADEPSFFYGAMQAMDEDPMWNYINFD
ncbi:hypothetical protein F5Y17DRAFT_463302 [Xylariaceae sp. FL0594]|nr:hypothetical protein F5Y17DRAFT_463302 [Xylariaceae sp. FL0594]